MARIWVEKPLELIKNDPKLVVGVGAGLALAIYASKHGTALLADAVKHYYRNPTLAQETSLLTPYEYIRAKIKGTINKSYSFNDIILESAKLTRFKGVADGIKNTAQNKGYFTHTLLYGPPGTGKTLLAKTIADASGLPFIYISGSSLRKFSLDEALIKLDELFNFTKKSSQPIVIIVDECEELFKKRDLLQQQNDLIGLQLLNHILMHTGTETANFVLIGLTNRPEIVDSAFLSRCSSIVEIQSPNLDQRKELLRSYVRKWLAPQVPSKRTFLSFLSSWNRPTEINIEMEETVFNENMINSIAIELDGFTGRDISQLIFDIKIAALSLPNRVIAQSMVEQVVAQKIEKKAIEAKLIAHCF